MFILDSLTRLGSCLPFFVSVHSKIEHVIGFIAIDTTLRIISVVQNLFNLLLGIEQPKIFV